MKKFITNNITKKFIWTILLMIIVLQVCFPTMVFAKIEEENYKTAGNIADTYDNWLKVINKHNLDQDEFDGAIIDQIRVKYFGNDDDNAENISRSLMKKRIANGTLVVRANYNERYNEIYVNGVWDKDYVENENDWDAIDEVTAEKNRLKFFNDYVNNPEGFIKDNSGTGFSEEESTMEKIFTYHEFKNFLGDSSKSDDEIYEMIKDKFKEFLEKEAKAEEASVGENLDVIAEYLFKKYIALDDNGQTMYTQEIKISVVARTDDNGKMLNTDYEITNVVLDDGGQGFSFTDGLNEYAKSQGGGSPDLGGMLLDLLVPFVTTIADTALSFLGWVMTGTDGIIVDKVAPDSYTNDQVVKVNMTEFKGDLLSFVGGFFGVDTIKHFVTNYSPEKIFAGDIELLSIDFISGKTSDGEKIEDSGWTKIRYVIAEWYKVLRMVAIIGFLSVLIYTGIKMMLSANAKDKAKFKEWLINWFVAVAILFSMHYIMSFIISVTGEISQLIKAACGDVIVEKCPTIVEYLGVEVNKNNLFKTDIIGYARFMIQSDNLMRKIGFIIMYIALIVYTYKFTFIYLKRLLNMAFLTLIAPIVALTYPIDKLNDGNAQGFQMWLKEYIFNALLQPMHLIMYYVLLGSAMALAGKNPLYAIAVLAFMTEAERLLKKIFGFEKAGGGTVGGMTGAFAAGALASNIKNIARAAGKLSGGNGGKPNVGDKENPLDNPKPIEDIDYSQFDDPQSEQQQLNEGQEEQQEQNEQNEQPSEAMKKYMNEGGNKNANGEYFNPNTDEYDAEYNPENDPLYGGTQQNSQQQQSQQTPQPTQQPRQPQRQTADSGKPVRQLSGWKKFGKGAAAVGKSLARPIWDFDRSGKYNGKRLARGIVKGVAGAAVGLTAAAVQAGISITDGKYNPMEGIATFGAGFAGGSGLVEGIGGLWRTGVDAAIEGDKEAIMKRAQARWGDREDVIKFNQREYPSNPKEAMRRQRDHYLPYMSDMKEMKRTMKYANSLMQSGMSEEAADKRAVAVSQFEADFQKYGYSKKDMWDAKKQKDFIDSMVAQGAPEDEAKIRGRYKNLFNAAQAFENAQL